MILSFFDVLLVYSWYNLGITAVRELIFVELKPCFYHKICKTRQPSKNCLTIEM